MYYVFRRPPHRPRPQQWIPSKALTDTGSDDFERVGPATRWAAFGQAVTAGPAGEPVISGGAVFAPTDGTSQYSAAFPTIQVEDQFCQVIFEAAPATNSNFRPAVYVRISALAGTCDYYAFVLAGVNVQIRKSTGGTEGTVAQEARTTAINTITGIKITAAGSLITGYVQTGGSWVEEINYTDPSPLTGSGYVGIGHSAAVGGTNPQGIESAAWGAGVGGVDGTVVAVPAVAAGAAPAAVVSAGSSVTAVPAVALATAPPANQMISSVVNAPAVTITAAAPAGTATGGGAADATVVAVPAVAAGDAPGGVLAADAAVVGVASVAAGDSPSGVLSGGSTVGGVPAMALADAPRQELSPSPEGENFTGLVAVTFSEGVT